jgi:neutral ceramidase
MGIYIRYILLVLLLPSQLLAQDFRASVVKRNITPEESKYLLGYGERKSTGILDSLYHKIVILDDGDTKFYLVSTDVCVISPSEYDRVARMLQENLGIDPVNFWWTATHTHSAPEIGPPGLPEAFMGERYKHETDTAYANFVAEELITGIEEGLAALTPAMLGVGWGYSMANINRRARDIDDVAFLGLNPEGPIDRRIGILKIMRKSDGNLLTLIANYPIHGTVMGGGNLQISGDAPGVVANYVEEKLGAPLLFINGAAGNLAPIYSVYPDAKSGRLNQFRRLLGDQILTAQEKICYYDDNVTMKVGALIFETPLKEGLVWPKDLAEYIRHQGDGPSWVQVPVRFLNINGEIGIWGSPLELFCEIANEVRDASPFPYTFFYGYTNGWLGYLVTDEELNYGGYEPSVSPFRQNAGNEFRDAVKAYLHGELKRK